MKEIFFDIGELIGYVVGIFIIIFVLLVLVVLMCVIFYSISCDCSPHVTRTISRPKWLDDEYTQKNKWEDDNKYE